MINTLRDLFSENEVRTMLKDGITVLRELMTDQKAGQETRRRAADSLLKHLCPTAKEKRARKDDEPPDRPSHAGDEPPSHPNLNALDENFTESDLIFSQMLQNMGFGQRSFFIQSADDLGQPEAHTIINPTGATQSATPGPRTHHELDVPPPTE